MKQKKANNKTALSSSNNIGRRSFMTGLGIGVILPMSSQLSAAKPDLAIDGNISQPKKPGDKSFIDRAFEMKHLAISKGDQPYGAVIVKNGKIIGQSWSRVILDQDPTAHAELAAIRDAASRQKSRDLSGAVLYSSSRACPMCEAAAYWAGINRMVHGKSVSEAGRPQLCGS